MYICSYVLVLVTSKLSDPITAVIAALISPQRFVMVLIGKDRKQNSLSDALLPAKPSKSFTSGKLRARIISGLNDAELQLMLLMDFRDCMIWVHFHSEESFSQFLSCLPCLPPYTWAHLHSAGVSLFAAEGFSTTGGMTAVTAKH